MVAFRGNADDEYLAVHEPRALPVFLGLVTVSGHGRATTRIYKAVNGNLILEAHFHKPASGDPGTHGVAFGFDCIDILVLSNGHTVRKLAARDGAVIWGCTSPDQACVRSDLCSTEIHHMLQFDYNLYQNRSLKHRSLRHWSYQVLPLLHAHRCLNPENGEVIETVNVP